MFRVWGKIFKDNHMLRDTVVCDDSNDTRTHKVMRALEEMCYTFDLGKPIWLEVQHPGFSTSRQDPISPGQLCGRD